MAQLNCSSALALQNRQPDQGIPCMLAPATSLANRSRRTRSASSLGSDHFVAGVEAAVPSGRREVTQPPGRLYWRRLRRQPASERGTFPGGHANCCTPEPRRQTSAPLSPRGESRSSTFRKTTETDRDFPRNPIRIVTLQMGSGCACVGVSHPFST